MTELPRDVAINVVANVIANLLTAAAVYLAGVAAGLLPYSGPIAIIAGSFIISVGLTFPFFFMRRRKPVTTQWRWLLRTLYTGAIGVPLLSVGFVLYAPEPSGGPGGPGWITKLNDVLDVLSVIVPFLVIVGLIVSARQHFKREHEKQQALAEQAQIEQQALAEQAERRQAYRNRPHRRLASREPRIMRRQRPQPRPAAKTWMRGG